MLYFLNDYCEGAHPAILQKLLETNMEKLSGYGTDKYCDSAKEKIRKACSCPDAEVYFLVGGTQTNATIIASVLNRYEGVLAAQTGHVGCHEAGAIEYTGHKVLTLPEKNGKISAESITDYVETFYGDANHEHMVFPGMVYISHPTEYGTLYTKKELEAMLVGYLGGRAAEELVFDTVTTGAANDIEQATKVARAMITQYGMSDKFGLMGLATQENQYLSGRTVLNCGDDTATEVDHEVMVLLHNSYEEAKRLIGSHREALDKIADYLIRRETITGKEFMKIFHAVERGIEIPENLDDLVIPEEKQNTVTLDKPEIQ